MLGILKLRIGWMKITKSFLVCIMLLTFNVISEETKIAAKDIILKPMNYNLPDEVSWFEYRFGYTWDELVEVLGKEEVDVFLERWREEQPNDPEAYISSANWNSIHSIEQIFYYSELPKPGAHVIIESKIEEGQGIVSLDGEDDPNHYIIKEIVHEDRKQKAHDLYTKAIAKFPYRVDIYTLLIQFHIKHHELKQIKFVLIELMNAINDESNLLETINYTKIKNKSEVFNSLIPFLGEIGASENDSPENFDVLLDASKIVTDNFPNNPIAWTFLSISYQNLQLNSQAYKAIMKAYNLDQSDEIINYHRMILAERLGLDDEKEIMANWLKNNAHDQSIVQTAEEILSYR